MYCPECGHDADDAKFCPECGADLSRVKAAVRGKGAGAAAGAGNAGSKAAPAPEPEPGERGPSPAIIWGGFGVLAVVVVLVVVFASGGLGAGSGDGAQGGGGTVRVDAVTEGSYRELVQKANELYDNGDAAFQSQDFEQGSEYFRAAAMTYAAAWKQQSTDPNVGTDYATALFYSGNIDAALEQIDQVIEQSPDFQPALFNLGNYLAHKGRIAEQQGDADAAAADFRKARRAYTRAVAIDPESEIGREADARLGQLPQ
jgi:hypothetical protein